MGTLLIQKDSVLTPSFKNKEDLNEAQTRFFRFLKPVELPKNGYGACSISGCYCQSYMGGDATCHNCGHNYYSHY